ncbi:MAG: (2Fe-2S) ferredoxin domain-containing protein [Bacteroidales bacterium]|jgi:NADH:ubiquinone oxidoreductase subunit E|nr:(2Fe-2S) ferredoxin domain-containing protein [Bacteroidales bacterium]
MKNKTVITICLGSSCYRRGNQTILEVIKNYLAEHDLSKDVEFKGQLCTDKCIEGPNLSIDDTKYSGFDTNSVIKVLNHHFFNT